MAIYHLTAKTGSRSGGQSARAKADYIQREGKYARDMDEVLHAESGHMPEFVERPADYWDAADLYERANGRLFKEVEFALPVELTLDQQKALASEFAQHLTGAERLPYTPAIEAEHLTRMYGTFTAAGDISFTVRQGEIFGLLGPNGAGKSTTFRMLCGLTRPTSGTCRVAGINMLSSTSRARGQIGYMAQKFSLYPDIPVWANIRIFGNLYGLSKNELEQKGRELSMALGLDGHLSDITGTLSLGLKQRLALLCATLHDPAVLFLDEPTSGVDVRTRRDFWKHILAMTGRGTSVLVTTHLMDEAEYCDTIALIYQGTMISLGSPDELKKACKRLTGKADPTLEEAFIAQIELHNARHNLEGREK